MIWIFFFFTQRTLHGSLQGVDGVDLCDDDAGAEPTQSLDAAFTHITITSHHGNFTSDHHIGGSLDAVDQALPAAVQVVKLTLREGKRQNITTCALFNVMSRSFSTEKMRERHRRPGVRFKDCFDTFL